MILVANHPLLLLSQELAALCKPLESLHIHHFTYTKRYYDGSRISLSNKPQWIADYYNMGLFDSSLFEAQPTIFQAGFNVWIGDYDLDVYRHGKQYYNTSHSITIIEPQKDGCEFYFFATAPEHYRAIDYIANNIDILHRFILFLKDSGALILQKASQQRITLTNNNAADGNQIILPRDKNYDRQMADKHKDFLKKTPIRKYIWGDDIKLSRREIDCVKYLLQGKTAPEIAQIINISVRTAESYIDNIKIKLNCRTKQELVDRLKKNKFLLALC